MGKTAKGQWQRLGLWDFRTSTVYVVGLIILIALFTVEPIGVGIEGAVLGGLSGLIAMGLILIYRSIRVINLAQAALGGLAAALSILLVTGLHWNYWLAVTVGVVVAAFVGFLCDLLIQWRFAKAPRLIVTVVTVGLAQILGFLTLELPSFFSNNLSPLSSFKTPFSFKFTVDVWTFTGDSLVALIAVPVILAALFWFFVRTDIGTAIRGASDSVERAQLLGIPVRKLTRVTWIVAAGLSGVGAILTQPIVGANLGSFSIVGEMLVPLAAFVLSDMESLPGAVFWSVVIGVLQEVSFYRYHQYVYSEVALFVLIAFGLLLRRRRASRVTGTEIGQYVLVREVRPIPSAIAHLKEIRVGRAILVFLIVGSAVLAPFFTSASILNDGIYCGVYAIIAVSMVILAGWAGQISLGQFAFCGIGASVTGAFMVHLHIPFLFALVLAGVSGALLAVLIGLPALRLEGAALIVITLSFALAVSDWVLSSTYFPWLDPSQGQVAPPVVLSRFNLGSYSTLYELTLLLVISVVVIASNLRRSRIRRSILAVRDNSRGAASYGISPLRTKLVAFGISGFIAGLAGAIYVVNLRGISSEGFSADLSVSVFVMVVIGGLGSISGGIIGALYFEVVSTVLSSNFAYLGTGAGVLVILMVFPEGLGGVLYWLRDSIVARVARANGLSALGEPIAPATMDETLQAEITPFDLATEPALAQFSASKALVEPLIRVSEIDVFYGESQVVFNANFEIAHHEVVALLGSNGAGKTTLVRALSGVLDPRAGKVEVFGQDITKLTPPQRVQAGLVSVFGGQGGFSNLTVEENLRLATWTAKHYQKDKEFAKQAVERVLGLFPILRTRLDQRAGLLSGGEQQILAVAQALICRPKVLIIDEFSLGLSPLSLSDLVGVVRELSATGVAILIIEQSENVATAISNRAITIENGRIFLSGANDKVRSSITGNQFSRTQTTSQPTSHTVVRMPLGIQSPAGEREAGYRSDPACEVSGISKFYGGILALEDVTFSVEKGEIVGIIGSNGAGKTTLFDVLSGFVVPNSGQIKMNGMDITRFTPAQRGATGLGRVFQDARLWPTMTVHEALATSLDRHVRVKDPLALALGLESAMRSETEVLIKVERLLLEMDLVSFRDRFISELSMGVRRIVELSCALAHEPSVLLLDEPTSGVAKDESSMLSDLLLGLREQTNASFVIIEHDVSLISSIADRVVCMNLGKIVSTGSVAEVLSDPNVVSSYLGGLGSV